MAQLGGVVDGGIDEVFDVGLGAKLVDADAPVYLSFFADCEAVGVDEGKGGVLKGGDQNGLGEGVARDERDVREG